MKTGSVRFQRDADLALKQALTPPGDSLGDEFAFCRTGSRLTPRGQMDGFQVKDNSAAYK